MYHILVWIRNIFRCCSDPIITDRYLLSMMTCLSTWIIFHKWRGVFFISIPTGFCCNKSDFHLKHILRPILNSSSQKLQIKSYLFCVEVKSQPIRDISEFHVMFLENSPSTSPVNPFFWPFLPFLSKFLRILTYLILQKPINSPIIATKNLSLPGLSLAETFFRTFEMAWNGWSRWSS